MGHTTQLDAGKFQNLLKRRGKEIKWEKATRCPCWNDDSGQPDYRCLACQGGGYIYDVPVVEDAILVVNLALNKEFTQLGEYRVGDCVMTIPLQKPVKNGQTGIIENIDVQTYNIGEWDKVTLLSSEFRTSEFLVCGESWQGRPADTLRNPDVTKILKIVTVNPSTGVIIVYNEVEDFTLSGAQIVWGVKKPARGQKYSVLYMHNPVYIVYAQLPQSRDQDGQHLPKKVVLRYRDVI